MAASRTHHWAMLNVYYPNAMVLAILVVEAVPQYLSAFRSGSRGGASAAPRLADLLVRHLFFGLVVLVCLLPTFSHATSSTAEHLESATSRSEIGPGAPGLPRRALRFQSRLACLDPHPSFRDCRTDLFRWREPRVGAPFFAALLAFYLFIACYPDWAGISSYGNRFFVSLTVLFILGLSVFLERFARIFRSRRAALARPPPSWPSSFSGTPASCSSGAHTWFPPADHLFLGNDPQSILRRATSAHVASRGLPLQAQSPHATDRRPRHPAAARKRSFPALTPCVYPNFLQSDTKKELYLTEDLTKGPNDADNTYGWAKLMGEFTLQAYAKEHRMGAASCRYFTVYGPRGVENHAVIAMIARAFLQQNPFEVWGDGTQIRNGLH